MARKPSRRKCPTCGEVGVKKNGRTSKGAIRYRCTHCGASYCASRPDISRKAELDQFVNWLTGKNAIGDLQLPSSTWRRRTNWCWRVDPVIVPTGQIYDYIQIDGTYLPYGWCLLTAVNNGKVLAWQWCNQENKAAYKQLLKRLPEPLMVITDGQAGALSAIKDQWPNTRVQRCLVHIKRNIRTLTTINPKIPAHKALWGLAKRLVVIEDLNQADQWVGLLQAFHDQWGKWLNHKTYKNQIPPEQIPFWIRPNQQWWYTHQKARRAYNLLAKQTRKATLFTFLDPTLNKQATTAPLPATTNELEGAINAAIKSLIYNHRGLSEPHMKKAAQWWCYQHSEHPLKPGQLIQPHHLKPGPKPEPKQPKPDPKLWDSAIDYNPKYQDGSLHIRKGWAGH